MIEVQRVNEATPEIAANLGRIMPFLSTHADGSPISIDFLKHTVESPSAVQFAAVVSGEAPTEFHDLAERYPIVGAATVSTLHGAVGEKAWLEDFVVVPEARGRT